MPQTINTNVVSLNAQRNMASSQASLATSMQRLSSGLRVNSARDDAAGLAIAERMSSQVRGMNVAVRNANDGISLSQTAEGALGKIADNLQRMRELAVQSRNGTNNTSDQASLQKEFSQLQQEIGRTVEATKFNNQSILKNDTGYAIQVGANTGDENTITTKGVDLTISTPTATLTGTSTDAEILSKVVTSAQKDATGEDANGTLIGGVKTGGTTDATDADIKAAIDNIDKAIDMINNKRADFGAVQNRFEAVISNLNVNIENQSAAKGRIMDADFATETANLSRSQILQQAGNAMVEIGRAHV